MYTITAGIKYEKIDENHVGLIQADSDKLFFMFREEKPVLAPILNDVRVLLFKPTTSIKFGVCWVLYRIEDAEGNEILHAGSNNTPLESRRILIHRGNYIEDSSGCLLPGTALEYVNSKPVIRHSSAAFDFLMSKARVCDVRLVINGNWKN